MKIQTQILVSCIPLSLAAGVAMTELSRSAVKKIVLAELSQRGAAKAVDLAAQAAPGVEAEKESMLVPLLQSAIDGAGAAYAFVTDPQGRVLAHSDLAEKDKVYQDPLTRSATAAAGLRTVQTAFKENPVIDFSMPVWGAEQAQGDDVLWAEKQAARGSQKRVGTVRIGIPLKGALATTDRIARRLGLILVGIGGAALLLVLLLVRRLLVPLRLLLKGIEEISHGNYGASLPTHFADELRDMASGFNRMSRILRNLIGGAKDISQTVTASSRTMSESSKNMLAIADRSALVASQVSTVVSQIAQSTTQVAQNAEVAVAASQKAASAASDGSKEIENWAANMGVIQSEVAALGRIISDLGRRSAQIGEIVVMIAKIADQTKILSINAAIEAGRAGQAGRGFAVVSDAIRKLAENSANSGKRINQLISEIQQQTLQAVDAGERCQGSVNAGSEVMKKAEALFLGIVGQVQEATSRIEQIAATVKETEAGAKEVAASSQAQTTTIKQAADIARKLAEESKELAKESSKLERQIAVTAHA